MKKFVITLLLLLIVAPVVIASTAITPDQIVTYKTTEQRELKLHIFYPKNHKKSHKQAVVVSFFGGGWCSGNPSAFYSESKFYTSLGLVAICADYRVKNIDKTTPYECVADGKSAIRWVRENCKMLGIDPNKIVASGGSAGGHVAACTAMIKDSDESEISPIPNGLILFNPVLNTTKSGYGADKMKKGAETQISPFHHITKGLPPTISFHGTNDKVSPYSNALAFEKEMKKQGNDYTLIKGFGEGHGFFNPKSVKETNSNRNFERAMYHCALFLKRLGYTDVTVAKPKDKVRVACIGNSITFGFLFEDSNKNSWPGVLQRILGDEYQVGKFAVSGTALCSKSDRPYIETSMYTKAKKFDADVVIIKLGTNDSKPANWAKSKEQFTKDYIALIDSFRKNENCTPDIYICSLTPSFFDDENPVFDNKIIRDEIIPRIKEVAKKCKVEFIDCYTHLAYKPELFPDKIHPTIDGAGRLAQIISNGVLNEYHPIVANY